jgi:uncharacterized membrane protein
VKAFDPRSLLFAKHAQHVVLIHFPIALFLTGALFDFAAQWTKRAVVAAAAFANLVMAALSVLPVLISGILAWQWQLEGQRLKGVLLLHLVLGSASGLLIMVAGWIHFRARRAPDARLPRYRLPLEFVTVLVVVVTAHLGGILSGVIVSG